MEFRVRSSPSMNQLSVQVDETPSSSSKQKVNFTLRTVCVKRNAVGSLRTSRIDFVVSFRGLPVSTCFL